MLRLLLLAFSMVSLPVFGADVVRVAAAANLTYVLGPIDAAFEKANPGTHVEPVFGATGSLYAQIVNGAPFDVLLSADTATPKKLVSAGEAGGEPHIFARGKLVVWTFSDKVPLTDLALAVKSPTVRKIAIAQPKTAPYGAAAMATLTRLGLLKEATPKLVIGENISQTVQFVQTGNADLGFVALSLVLGSDLVRKGRWAEVPASLYPSLDQAEVLTKTGKAHPAAGRYADYLLGTAARARFESAGYALP